LTKFANALASTYCSQSKKDRTADHAQHPGGCFLSDRVFVMSERPGSNVMRSSIRLAIALFARIACCICVGVDRSLHEICEEIGITAGTELVERR
jgi:hypothetical protein